MMPPGRKKQAKINAAAQARTAWLEKFKKPADENFDLAVDTNDIPEMISISSDITDTEGDWDGTVNYCPSSDSEFCWTDTEDSDSDTIDELDGEDLYTSIDAELARELEELAKETAYEIIMKSGKEFSNQKWSGCETKLRTGVHIGNASRSHQCYAKAACEKAVTDAMLRKL